MKRSIPLFPALVLGLALLPLGLGCLGPEVKAQEGHPDPWAGITRAVCALHPTAGNQASGTVVFTQTEAGVRMVADVSGLTPCAKHGFHIHEFGDCSAADGTSLGGHYNPEGHQHAGPADASRHAGDLGNLEADAEGKAHLELTLTGVSVAGHMNPVVGRGIVVHAQTDDLKTQPTGGAGARIAVGAIGIAKAQ